MVGKGDHGKRLHPDLQGGDQGGLPGGKKCLGKWLLFGIGLRKEVGAISAGEGGQGGPFGSLESRSYF